MARLVAPPSRWEGALPYLVFGGGVVGMAGVVGVKGGGVEGLLAALGALVGWVWMGTVLWAMHVILWPGYEGVRPWRAFLRPGAWIAAAMTIRWLVLIWVPPPVSPLAWIPGLSRLGYATDILWGAGFVGAWWTLREVVGEQQARGIALGSWGLSALMLVLV